MREISAKELLQLQLNILHNVDSFCRKNCIEYFLVGGTGIGAIRHGGYIPWDDDIDIGMTRPNYNNFILLFNGSFPNLKVYAPEIDMDYYAPYANVCDTRTVLYEGMNGHRKDEIGVKIDIFPYDGVPSAEQGFEELRGKAIQFNQMAYVKRIVINKVKVRSLKGLVSLLIKKLRLLPRRYSSIQNSILELTKVVPYDDAKYLEKIVFPYDNNMPCKKEIFESYCDMPFEDLTVRNLKDYDTYLRSVFGDYMQLPPENKRVMQHGFKAYWKDK